MSVGFAHQGLAIQPFHCSLLEELSDDDFCMDDGHRLKPAEVHSYLCRVLYNRRNKWVGLVPLGCVRSNEVTGYMTCTCVDGLQQCLCRRSTASTFH